jgi:hypothetical protein
MLKKHGFKPAFDCRPLFLDSKHLENISIIRDHIVGFCGVAEIFAVVQEVKLCFRVHFCSSQEGKDSQNEDESLAHGGFTIMYTNSRKKLIYTMYYYQEDFFLQVFNRINSKKIGS